MTDISPAWLKEQGFEAILLDLDNTLVPYRSFEEPAQGVTDWLQAIKSLGIQVVIVSNGSKRRVEYWTKRLEVPGFGPAGKPWSGFGKALKQLGLPASKVAVVGDQVFTDVLGGNLVGAFTILVRPLSDQELIYTKAVRWLERLVLAQALPERIKIPNAPSDPKILPKSSTMEDVYDQTQK
jgi:uncharacterized protein